MLGKLGKNFTIINIAALIVVILVGGASIFLTRYISKNMHATKELSEHILTIENMHARSFQYQLAIHHFLIEPGKIYAAEATYLLLKLEKDVNSYIEREEAIESEESLVEVNLMTSILANIDDIKKANNIFGEFSETGGFNRDEFKMLEMFANNIEYNIAEINSLYFRKISDLDKESAVYMNLILMIYVIFLVLGAAAIFIGYRVLSRRVISPIKVLASATLEFSEGTFDKRVKTDAWSEIDMLYSSFNRMADKIQEHSKLLHEFNEEMERKVRDRTSELEKANEQLQKTQNSLIRSEKMAAIGQISAGVAHEIKNPLNSLFINAQILQREISDKLSSDSQFYESISLIKFEINRINNILEEFVKFAKYPEPQFVNNDINQVISDVAALISENAKRSEIELRLNLDDNIPAFKFDALQLKTLLMNLALNAFNALDGKGVLGLGTSFKDGQIILKVSDDGKGIRDKDKDMIFSPFFSTREQGLGLGLSIVQRVVENHGGSIKCMSKEGEGTVFEVTFPIE